ncbi:MAG: amino acid adenylation domain-containing protein [Acidobacteriota bacterium]
MEPLLQGAPLAIGAPAATAGQASRYWQRRLEGAGRPDLPRDFRSPTPDINDLTEAADFVRVSVEVSPPPEIEGIPLFFLVAFEVLLYRFSAGDETLVAARNAGRAGVSTALIAPWLPLRGRPDGELPFDEYLEARRREVGEDGGYCAVSPDVLEEVVGWMDVAFWAGQEGATLPETGRQWALALRVSRSSGSTGAERWQGTVLGARNTFEESTVRRLAHSWQTLLAGLAADPTVSLGRLPLLTATERSELWADGRPTERFAPGEPLHQRFAAQAGARPWAVALTWEGGQWTYQELESRANRLAHGLRLRGVERGTPVGLFVERGPGVVLGILAILKAAGGYVPIDPGYPAQRVRHILEDCAAPLVLTERALEERLPGDFWGAPLFLEDAPDHFADLPSSPPAVPLTSEDLAYVIYTSGSTGRPKGVPISHGRVGRLFAATDGVMDTGPDDVWSLFHSFAFDFSVWEIWGALLYGGRLVVVPYWVSRSPSETLGMLVREGVTVLNQTPSAFQALVGAVETAAQPPRLALRRVVFGGEALDLESLRPWFARFGDESPRLINMYGITETTVHVTVRPVLQEDLDRAAGSMIGRPMADLGVALLGPELEPVPGGAPGEICVRGAGLAQGYLRRPALTAQRFIPDPAAAEPGGRLYRSGDLARALRGGTGELQYLGRIDHQVKIRGFRLELGEIESALARHPAVAAAVVLLRQDVGPDPQLVAYLVLPPPTGAATGGGEGGSRLGHSAQAAVRTAGGLPSVMEWREFLGRSLPPYMIPAFFVPLKHFPLTVNGKIDRRRLPLPELRSEAAVDDPPTTELERALVEIWATHLGIPALGIHEEFFALGGHSLTATAVVAEVSRRWGVPFSHRDLYEHPTVAKSGRRIEAMEGEEAGLPPLTAGGWKEGVALPASLSQERLWFLERLQGESNICTCALTLKGAVEIPLLQASLEVLVQRHAALRTCFGVRDGVLQQIVHPQLPGGGAVPMPVVDLSGLASGAATPGSATLEIAPPGTARPGTAPPGTVASHTVASHTVASDTVASHTVASAARLLELRDRDRPFELERLPLLRATLVRMGAADHCLLLTLHHMIFDGWALQVVARDLGELYQRRRSASPVLLEPLEPPEFQYPDFALWQRRCLEEGALEEQLGFWRQRLRDRTRVVELPVDHPVDPEAVSQLERRALLLESELTARLRQCSREANSSLFMTLFALFQVFLQRYTEAEDGVVLTVTANRNQPGLEGLVGFVVNTLALPLSLGALGKEDTFRDLLGRVRRSTTEAFHHQEVPFEALLRELRLESTLLQSRGGAPVLFVLQNAPAPRWSVEGVHLTVREVEQGMRDGKLGLIFFVYEEGEHLSVEISYNADAFDETTIQRLLGQYERLCEAAVAAPEAPIRELSPLCTAERHQLLFEWGGAQRDLPANLPGDLLADLPADLAVGDVRLLDDDRNPVPIGAPGRLFHRPGSGDRWQLLPAAEKTYRYRGDGRLVAVPTALEKSQEKVAAVHSRERAASRRSRLNPAQRAQLAERLRQLKLSSHRSPAKPPRSES